jgi:hypothetical protein
MSSRNWQTIMKSFCPKRVQLRVEPKTASPSWELRLNGIPGGGARREGSNMTKIQIGLSTIESISKRLEIVMNPSRTGSFADRVDSTVSRHGRRKRHTNIQEIIISAGAERSHGPSPFDSLPRHDLLGIMVRINIRIETSQQHERSRTPRPSYSSMQPWPTGRSIPSQEPRMCMEQNPAGNLVWVAEPSHPWLAGAAAAGQPSPRGESRRTGHPASCPIHGGRPGREARQSLRPRASGRR